MGRQVINRTLVKGSVVLLIAFGLFNFFHFIFQFFMARMLSISDYGILATVFAVIYITAILSESIQTIIAKYSAGEDNAGKLHNLLRKSFKKAFYFGAISFALYIILAMPLSFLLKIDYVLLALNGFVLFFAFFIPVTRGLMQGRKRFTQLGVNMVGESVGKLLIGVFLVFLGWRVFGAVIGLIAGGAFSLLFAFIQLRPILRTPEEKFHSSGIYAYARPTFFISSVVIIFYSLDVIVAKMLFSAQTAGAYAIASVLGKIIFWGTLPISKAMFPLSATDDKNNAGKGVLANALVLVLLGAVCALALFYAAPGSIIQIFSGRFIPEAISILFLVGIAFSITAITNLLLLHYLSLNKVKGSPLGLITVFAILLTLSFLSGFLYAYLASLILLYLTVLLAVITLGFAAYAFVKKYDIGLFLFVIIEALLLYAFRETLIGFSIAFIIASVIFLCGTIYFRFNEKDRILT